MASALPLSGAILHGFLTRRRLRIDLTLVAVAIWSIWLFGFTAPGVLDRYGKVKGTVPGKPTSDAILATWIGPKPGPGDDFKKAVEFGFAFAYWCGSGECEEKIKEETRATMRCIPLDPAAVMGTTGAEDPGVCVYCQKPAKHRAIFARAY